MEVSPKLQEFLNLLNEIKPKLVAMGFKHTQTNMREAFANAQRRYMTDIDYSVSAIDDIVYNESYPVPIRIYIPHLNSVPSIAVFIHGGGHASGSISQYDGITRKLAKQSSHIIISIEYRLSPEFNYPVALQDCKAVITGLFHVLESRKIQYKGTTLKIIGDSAGGALCASIVQDKKFISSKQITHQVLLYPLLDYTMSSPSIDKFGVGYYLEKSIMEWYFHNYCDKHIDRVAISPLFGEFYPQMPETLIVSCGYDPLQDEAKRYYNQMLEVEAKTELLHVKNVTHAFLSLENLCSEECAITYKKIASFLNP